MKIKKASQNLDLEKATFEQEKLKDGLEPLKEEDYIYFYNMIKEMIPKSRGVRILEVGCGSGAFGIRLAKLGYSLTGIDISGTLIKAAKRKASQTRVKYAAKTADVMKYRGKYDAVLCAGFLHHFTDLDQIIKKLGSFLNKGGRVFFVEPNGSNPAIRITEKIRKNVWPFSKMSELGTANETSHTAEQYRMAFDDAGFREEKLISFIKRPLFGDYGAVLNVVFRLKYLFHAAASLLMKKDVRGTVIVASFVKKGFK